MKSKLWPVGILAALLLWQLVSALVASLVLPGPLAVLHKLGVLLMSGHLLADVGLTLVRVAVGTAFGCGLGLALGVLMAHNRPLAGLLDPVFQILRPVSPFAWTPLVILLFGLGDAPAVLTILVGILFPAIVLAYETVRAIDPNLRDIARIFGVAGWPLVCQVELPLIAPALSSAARVFLGVGWVLAIGAEMLAANSGLGFRLMNARYLLDFTGLYALILLTGILGYGLDFGLRRLARTG